MQTRKLTVLLILFSIPLSMTLWGQQEAGLFDSHELMEIRLTLDIKAIQKDIGEKRSYHGARFRYKNPERAGQEIEMPVQVKARGNFRRNPKICDFPPIMLKFSKDHIKDNLFQGQRKLKLVTYCKKNIKTFEEYVLKEYLIYRIYNLLTDRSLKVRLVRVTYENSRKKSKPLSRYGILIENDKLMAQRLNGKIIKNKNKLSAMQIFSRVDRYQRLIQAVFQFLVGHTDWSLPAEHNIELVETKGTGGTNSVKNISPVPYDFDLAGLVNAHYAKPSPQLKIKSVRDRLYRGYCAPLADMEPVFELFRRKKEEIYNLIDGFQYLKPKRRAGVRSYLDRFYKILDNPRQIKKHFKENCR